MTGSFRQVRAVFFILKSAVLRLAFVPAMAGVIPAREVAVSPPASPGAMGGMR
jgi:hypothetical protein